MVRDHRRRLVLPVRHVPGDVRPGDQVFHRGTLRPLDPIRWAHRRRFGDLGAGEPVATVGVATLQHAIGERSCRDFPSRTD